MKGAEKFVTLFVADLYRRPNLFRRLPGSREFVVHTNSTQVLHTNSTQVLHTNNTQVIHTNSTKVLLK